MRLPEPRNRHQWLLLAIAVGLAALGIYIGIDIYISHHPLEQAEWLWSPENPEPDFRESMRQFRIAADRGSAEAMGNVGWLYEIGKGVDHPDCLAAMQWYEQAVANGNATANWNIGRLYETGCGVKQDLKAARIWYQKAADLNVTQNGINIGKRELERLDRGDVWPPWQDRIAASSASGAIERKPPATLLGWFWFILKAPETWEAVFGGAILAALTIIATWLSDRFSPKVDRTSELTGKRKDRRHMSGRQR